MERVYLLVEDMTQRRLSCLLNPETLVQRRLAGVQPRRSATGRLTGSGLADDPLLYTGGGYTELALDLLFDLALVDKPQKIENVRTLTQPLWELADTAPNGLKRGQPLMVRFLWGKEWNFLGVVVAVAERLDMFTSEGVPQRSWLRLKLVRSNPPAAEPAAARRRLSATEVAALAARVAQAPEGLAEPVRREPGEPGAPDQDQASGPRESEAAEAPEGEAADGAPELDAAAAPEGEATGAEVPVEAEGGAPLVLEGTEAPREGQAAAGPAEPGATGAPEEEPATPLAQAEPEAGAEAAAVAGPQVAAGPAQGAAGPAESEAAPAAQPERRWRLARRERLDQVAYRYYGDPAYWRLLAIFNGIDDPLHIPDGTELRVPSIALVSEGP